MFEEKKDKLIEEERFPISDGKYLTVGLYSYNGGAPKIGFYREVEGKRKRAGRLTQGEASWASEIIPEILSKIE